MDPFVPPRLPPDLDWGALIRDVAAANAALAKYDGLLQGPVNPDILIAPLWTREAVLSSRIEGTQATLEDVFVYEAYPVGRLTPEQEEIQEIINYRAAVQFAVAQLERSPFSVDLIRGIHSVLMEGVRGHEMARGQLREVQNYIALTGEPIERARYVPPPPEEVEPLLADLEKYVREDENDVIVQIGLVHAQFELVHPFLDGNGRVGRILIPLLLSLKGAISTPAFYLSGHLEANRDEYYHRLGRISSKADYQGWSSFFLGAVAEHARSDGERILEMLGLYERSKQLVWEATRSRFVVQMLDALFRWPVFSTRQFSRNANISAASAARLLKALEKAELVEVIRPGSGRRPAIWSFPALLEILR